jgi:FkbM family methyltransferase
MKTKFTIEAIHNKRVSIFDPTKLDERKYLLFPNDNAVTASLFRNELYEPYLYQFLKENNLDIRGTNVVDIGGNNGQIAIEFAHLVGDNGKVFSFEPQRVIFQQLCANVFVNGLDNVYAFNIAIGSEEGLTTIQKPNYFDDGFVNFGDVHVGVQSDYETVMMRKLDSFSIDNISIIKIDVQGFEKKVLLGAKETIQKNKPIIYVEIEEDQLQLYGDSENSVLQLLIDYGYSFTRFNSGISYQTNTGLCLDFVAIPNELVSVREWKTIFH